VPCVVCGQKLRSKLTYYAGYSLFGGGTGIQIYCQSCTGAFTQLPEDQQRFYLKSRIKLAFPSPQVIYAEKDPTTGERRYIGRTGKPVDRHSAHTRDKKSGRSIYRPATEERTWYSKSNWIYDLNEQGLRPIQEILHMVEPPFYIIEYEQRYIWHAIQQGWPILNHETQNHRLVSRIRHSPFNFLTTPFEWLLKDGWFWQSKGIEAFLHAWHEADQDTASFRQWLAENYPTIHLD